MGNFDKGKRFGGGRDGKRFGGKSFGGDRKFGGNRDDRRDTSRPDMHKAICSECGKSCEVPFRPTGDKPVFCSDCFRNKREGSQDRGSRDNRGGGYDSKPRFENKKTYQPEVRRDSQDYKAQFEMLNSKLDRILKALNPTVSEETKKVTETPVSKKFEKAPKKEVDAVALKKALTKTMGTKKAVAEKKPVAKKVAVEKKSVAKKAPAKTIVKKVTPKKATPKKK